MCIQNIQRLVENESDHKLKFLHTNRGGEFISYNLSKFCEEKGIKNHITTPYTPQPNGVVERRNRTIMNTSRACTP